MSNPDFEPPSNGDLLHLPRKPWRGLELSLQIEGLTAKGQGMVLLEVAIGPQKVLRRYRVEVRGTLPGERVRVWVEGLRRGVISARVVEVETPSPLRQKPRCKHFGSPSADGHPRGCGGCTLQSLPYARQLDLKRDHVRQFFTAARLDGELVREVRGMETPWYYRNKMEYSFAKTRERPFALGLHPPGYHREVIALEECFLLSPFAAAFLPRAAAFFAERHLPPYEHRDDKGFLRTLTLREGKRTGERMVVLTTAEGAEVIARGESVDAHGMARDFAATAREIASELGEQLSSIIWTQQRTRRGEPTRFIETQLYGKDVLHEELQIAAGPSVAAQTLRFEIHPRAFFQPNSSQAEVLYGEVLRAAGVSEAAPRSLRALDLYCGTGTIALCLAPYCQQVLGVELSAEAVDNAGRNALFNNIDNARFFAGDAGQLLEGELAAERGKVDVVVVDPPRSGLAPAALTHLSRVGAKRLVYVSCNPEALARDLLALRRKGYEARSVQPVDMFPHTAHIENVALLERG